MTPDGRDGFATLMLRRGYSSYVMDLPGRGRAGRTSATTTVKPLADEMFWFDIWRIGIWPEYNKGVQFPSDSAYLSQFFREMTPDISDHKQDVPAINALTEKIGDNILVTHSAGGFRDGWPLYKIRMSRLSFHMSRVAMCFRGGGARSDRRTYRWGDWSSYSYGTVLATTRIPIVMYFGDYIPETPSENLGGENWRVRLQMGRKFVEAINRHGETQP